MKSAIEVHKGAYVNTRSLRSLLLLLPDFYFHLLSAMGEGGSRGRTSFTYWRGWRLELELLEWIWMGRPNKPMAICMSGAGGFVGSHLREKLMAERPRKVPELVVYGDKIKHLFEPSTLPLADRVQFHRVNIKHDYRLEGLIKMSDLVIFPPSAPSPSQCDFCPLLFS